MMNSIADGHLAQDGSLRGSRVLTRNRLIEPPSTHGLTHCFDPLLVVTYLECGRSAQLFLRQHTLIILFLEITMLKSILSRLVLMTTVLLPAVPALARVSDAFSPEGTWELKVTGTYEGYKVNGIAYIEFVPDGTLAGYYLSRTNFSVVEVEGEWEQNDKSFTGLVVLSDDVGYLDTFDLSGKAKAGKSLSARITNGADQIKISGKPMGGLPDMDGQYEGTVRQYGQTFSVVVDLEEDPGRDGGYELSGWLYTPTGIKALSGYALAARDGRYVAFIENQTDGIYSSIWGKIKVGAAFTGSGVSLEDGSKIKVKMTPTG